MHGTAQQWLAENRPAECLGEGAGLTLKVEVDM
jgi:hypothetical protein